MLLALAVVFIHYDPEDDTPIVVPNDVPVLVIPARRRAAAFPEKPTRVRVGDVATFGGSHGVSGSAAIVSPNTIRVTMFNHDGSAPGLDIRVGVASMRRIDFRVIRQIGRTRYQQATFDIVLPSAIDLDAFDTFTVWCYEFNVVIAEGKFRKP